MMEVELLKNKVIFNKKETIVAEFDLTDKEANELSSKFLKITRELDYHRGYYDMESKVYITKYKTTIKYYCEQVRYKVYDTVKNKEYVLINEEEAKGVVDILRENYRI